MTLPLEKGGIEGHPKVLGILIPGCSRRGYLKTRGDSKSYTTSQCLLDQLYSGSHLDELQL